MLLLFISLQSSPNLWRAASRGGAFSWKILLLPLPHPLWNRTNFPEVGSFFLSGWHYKAATFSGKLLNPLSPPPVKLLPVHSGEGQLTHSRQIP